MTAPLNIGQMLSAQARLQPERIGARDLERAMTYRLWNERARRLANALVDLGLSRGARLAVLAYNRVEWAEIFAGAAKAGLVVVPINFRLTSSEVRYIIENAEASAILAEDCLADKIEAIRDELDIDAERYVLIGRGKAAAGWKSYEDLASTGADEEPDICATPDEPWCLMYTSGTTGRPKGAIRSHRGVAMIALMTAAELAIQRRDDALLVMPMCHANSLFFFSAFMYGGRHGHDILPPNLRASALPQDDGRDRNHLHLAGPHPLHNDAGCAGGRARNGGV